MDPKPHQRHKLFLFTKVAEQYPLMIRDSDNTLPSCAKDFFILLNDISGIFRFIHFLLMCSQINNFPQKKFALKPVQDFLRCFGSTVGELSTAANRILNRLT